MFEINETYELLNKMGSGKNNYILNQEEIENINLLIIEKGLTNAKIEAYFNRFPDLEYSEDRDIVSSSIVLNKYKKGLIFLFNKYTTPIKKKKNNQEYIERKISISEIWKLLFENNISNFISKEEITIGAKYLNLRNFGKMQINTFDYQDFCKFLLFLSVYLSYKQNTGKTYKIMGSFLEEFIIFFQNRSNNKEVRSAFFQEKKIVTEEIFRLNEILEKNPKTVIEMSDVRIITLFSNKFYL